MFQEQLYKAMTKENVKDLVQKGKIKYANIAPIYGLMVEQDAPKKEAEKALNLLLSNKKLYLVLKQGDEDEKPEIKAKREQFEKEFNNLAKSQLDNLISTGQVIYKKQALAKDWNEFFTVMKRDMRFQQHLATLEEKYLSYSDNSEVTKKNGKKP